MKFQEYKTNKNISYSIDKSDLHSNKLNNINYSSKNSSNLLSRKKVIIYLYLFNFIIKERTFERGQKTSSKFKRTTSTSVKEVKYDKNSKIGSRKNLRYANIPAKQGSQK